MRNGITFGFIFLSTILYGQEFLNESCIWKTKDLAYVDLVYFNADYSDYIKGDTIIDNSTYFKVYRSGKSISGYTPADSMFTTAINEYLGRY